MNKCIKLLKIIKLFNTYLIDEKVNNFIILSNYSISLYDDFLKIILFFAIYDFFKIVKIIS